MRVPRCRRRPREERPRCVAAAVHPVGLNATCNRGATFIAEESHSRSAADAAADPLSRFGLCTGS